MIACAPLITAARAYLYEPRAPGLSGVRPRGDGCAPREAPTCLPPIVLNGRSAAKLVETADFTKRVASD
jgi:hypothetical protein